MERSTRLEGITRFAIATLLVWGLVMGLVHAAGIVSDTGDAVAAGIALGLTTVAYGGLGLWRIGRLAPPRAGRRARYPRAQLVGADHVRQ